jgi:hypothetical protein
MFLLTALVLITVLSFPTLLELNVNEVPSRMSQHFLPQQRSPKPKADLLKPPEANDH